AGPLEGVEVDRSIAEPHGGEAPVALPAHAEREVVAPEAVRHGAPTRRAGPGAARHDRCGTPRAGVRWSCHPASDGGRRGSSRPPTTRRDRPAVPTTNGGPPRGWPRPSDGVRLRWRRCEPGRT